MSIVARSMKAFCAFRLEQSMVKDAPPFNMLFTAATDKVVEKLNARVISKNAEICDPAASAWMEMGFTPIEDAIPFYPESDPTEYFINPTGELIFCVAEIRDRLLPGTILKAEVANKVKELQAKQDDTVTRKQIMEIKDVVAASLLAKALIKPRRVPILIMPDENDAEQYIVLVFNGSRKVCEDVNALLRNVFGSFPVRPYEHDFGVEMTTMLTHLVRHNDFPWLRPGTGAKLVSHKDGEYTVKDDPIIENEHVGELLSDGYTVQRLDLRHFDSISPEDVFRYCDYKVTSKFNFSGIKMSDLMATADDAEDALQDFVGWLFIFADEIGSMLSALEKLSKKLAPNRPDTAKIEKITVGGKTVYAATDDDDSDELDPLFNAAKDEVAETCRASISSLQRKFRIGYNRASRIIEQLEAAGIVSEQNSEGNRDVLVAAPAEYDENDEL